MKRIILIAAAALLTIGIGAWIFSALTGGGTADQTDSSSSSSLSSEPETSSSSSDAAEPDQTFRGKLQPLGPSVYMEGTHRLEIAADDFLLLRSDFHDLQLYEDTDVQVTGPVTETIEGGRLIMTVMEITLLSSDEPESSSSSAEASSSSEVEATEASSSSRASTAAPPPAPAPSPTPSPVPPPPPPPPARAIDDAMQARIAKMAKPKGDGSWTQQYCSAHIGFCFAVRSDYWYRSFGATDSSLWHVELNSEEIQAIGDGPIVVSLVSGRLDPAIVDQSVVVSGDYVFGYRSWTGNRHFEITAPVELRAAVEHITANILPYEPAESSASSQ